MAYPTEADAEIAGMNWNRHSLTQNPITGERTLTLYAEGRDETRKGEVATRLNEIKTLTDAKYDSNKATAEGIWDVQSAGWDPQLRKWVRIVKSRAAYQMPPNPEDGVTEGTTVAEDVFSKTLEIQYFNQESPPTPTLYELYASGGILRVLSAAVDAMKKWRVELRTVKSKYSQITFTVSPRIGYTETHIITRNQLPAESGGPVLPAPTEGYINDYAGSPSRNPDGTWNWYLVIRPDDSLLPDNGEGIIRKYSLQYRKQPWSPNGTLMITDKSDIYWFSSLTVHEFVYKMYSSASAAWAATRNGYKISDKPVHIGYGRWMVMFAYEFQNAWNWTGDMAEYRGGE